MVRHLSLVIMNAIVVGVSIAAFFNEAIKDNMVYVFFFSTLFNAFVVMNMAVPGKRELELRNRELDLKILELDLMKKDLDLREKELIKG
ncbi:hypothetical protein [Paenibacillus lutrae]|uniref:Uncharacterized protein n=1 Tax=Paenibacillus lutrae TaxID=2078573 RepID=A0A7X3JZU7_9BACL|nr:hypothetical protein [Paenibacillus lutrae]MVP00549.1 hypothetical protein [Paenibacillus lutrae]